MRTSKNKVRGKGLGDNSSHRKLMNGNNIKRWAMASDNAVSCNTGNARKKPKLPEQSPDEIISSSIKAGIVQTTDNTGKTDKERKGKRLGRESDKANQRKFADKDNIKRCTSKAGNAVSENSSKRNNKGETAKTIPLRGEYR